MYGNSSSPAEGDAVVSASSGTSYKATAPTSFILGDKVATLAMPRATSCSLSLDSIANVPGDGTVSLTTGLSGLKTGDIVYNFGAQPIVRAYAVRQGNLTMCDYTAYNCGKASYATTLNSDVWVPVGSGVVSLRAQYGHDKSTTMPDPMTGVVTAFDQTTPSSSGSPACEWARMLSVRLALVARGGQYDANKNAAGEVSEVTGKAPSWVASSELPINLSALSDWQQYRYKTVETSIPLRNMLWQGGQPGYQGGDSGC